MNIRSQQHPSIAVIVISCDRYADLWRPFFFLFKRFWADCPYKVYLVTNHDLATFPGVITLQIGEDVSWSGNVRKALAFVEEEYVLMFLEDFFLCGRINRALIARVEVWIEKERPDYVLLNPTEKSPEPFNSLVDHVPVGALYRASTVLSLWKKETLLSLLKEGENAWDFELQGSERSDVFDRFFATRSICFPIVNGVIKGKWQLMALATLKNLGAEVDLKRRPQMTTLEALCYKFNLFRTKVFKFVPWKHRRQVRAWLKRT